MKPERRPKKTNWRDFNTWVPNQLFDRKLFAQAFLAAHDLYQEAERTCNACLQSKPEAEFMLNKCLGCHATGR